MSWWLALGECKDTVVRCMLEYMDERGVVLALLLGGLLLLLFGFLYSRNNRKDQIAELSEPPLVVTKLYYYPIKSCCGIEAKCLAIDRLGFKLDRRYLVVDTNNAFLTQRKYPKMSLIRPTFLFKKNERKEGKDTAEMTPDNEGQVEYLCLNAPGMGEIRMNIGEQERIPLKDREEVDVTIWNSVVRAWVAPKEVNLWLSSYFHAPVRLVRVRMDNKTDLHIRKINEQYDIYPHHRDIQVSFSDGYPILLTSESSLAQLNSVLLSNGPTAKNNNSVIKQIGKKDKLVVTPMTSFRPNIVVKGANSFDEDDWKKIKIVNQNDNKNHPEFHVVKPCSRCQIPNINQVSSEQHGCNEPRQTLHAYRQWGDGVYFGQNLVHVEPKGRVAVGDCVKILERKVEKEQMLKPNERIVSTS